MHVYLNPMQREALLTRAQRTIVCAGRGTGKGLLHAAMALQNMQTMPGCTLAFVSPDAKRALTNTLPSMFQHWEAWGYRRGVHWNVGVKPLKRLGWGTPIIRPENWDNMISFYNGAVGMIVSQSRIGTSNSKSFDFLHIDEAKFIDFEQLKSETIPANRGQTAQFGHLPYHHGWLVTSDMPTSRRGSWFLRYEAEADPARCALVRTLALEREAMAAHNQDTTQADQLLNTLRRGLTYYGRFPSSTNVAVLGEAWLRQMKRDLPPAEYRASILCEPIARQQDGFYSSLTDDNYYTATNETFILRDGYNTDTLRAAATDSRADADLTEELPLAIAFDFNSNINCLVVAQADEEASIIRVVHAFHVKYHRKLRELCADFTAYYHTRRNRDILFYYDSTALGSNYAVNTEDFRYVICQELERSHWTVRPIPIGRPLGHIEKHLLLNRMLAGEARLRVMINRTGCTSLIASIEGAGVWNGKKDKRLEKTRETTESPLETRTDLSDAFDTLLIGLERFPQRGALLRITSDF